MSVTTKKSRPLAVLETLIQDELGAAEEAGKSRYARIGRLLEEARPQVDPSKWEDWLRKKFDISVAQAHRYVRYAKALRNEAPALHQRTMTYVADPGRDSQARRIAEREAGRSIAALNVERMSRERADKERERRLVVSLMTQIVTAGYRVLAPKLHPDRGGSHEAMARLNEAKRLLKVAIERI